MRSFADRRPAWRLASALGAVIVAAATATTSVGATSAENLARAQSEAPRLLSLLQLPSGATASAGEPSDDHRVLAMPGYDEVTPNLVDAHAFWTVPGRAADVLAYVASHLPAGARRYGSASGNIAPGYAMESFALPPIPGVLSQRIIAVTVVQLSSDTTGVRTDGEAVWIVPRPGWERIPGRASSVVILVRRLASPGRGGPITTTYTLTGFRVHRLVTFINRLGVVQPGVRLCPAALLLSIHLRFLAPGGTTLARAVEYPTGCASLTLTVGTRPGPALNDSPSVLAELEHMHAVPVLQL